MSETSEALLFVNGQAVLLTSNTTDNITVNSINGNKDEININEAERLRRDHDEIQHLQIQYQNVSQNLQENREDQHQTEKMERGLKIPLDETKTKFEIQNNQTFCVSNDSQNNQLPLQHRIHNENLKENSIENQELNIICWPNKDEKNNHKILNFKGKCESDDIIMEENSKHIKDLNSVVSKDSIISVGILNSFDKNISMNTEIYLNPNEPLSENNGLNNFVEKDVDEMSDTNIYIVSTDEDFLESFSESNNVVQKSKSNSSSTIKNKLNSPRVEELQNRNSIIEQKNNNELSSTGNMMQHCRKESKQYNSVLNNVIQPNKQVDKLVNGNQSEAIVVNSNNSNVSSIIAMLQGEDGSTQTLELSSEEAQQLGIIIPNSVGFAEEKQFNSSKEDPGERLKHDISVKFDNIEQKIHIAPNPVNQLPLSSPSTLTHIQNNVQSSEIVQNPSLSEPLLIIPDFNTKESLSMIKLNESQEREKSVDISVKNIEEPKPGSLLNLSEYLTLMKSDINSSNYTNNTGEGLKFRPLLPKENSPMKTRKPCFTNATPYIQKLCQLKENEKKGKIQKMVSLSESQLEVSKGIRLLNPSIRDRTSHNAKSILQGKYFTHINKSTSSKNSTRQRGNISEKNIFSIEKIIDSVNLGNISVNPIKNEESISFRRDNRDEIIEIQDHASYSKNESRIESLGNAVKIQVNTGTTFDGQEMVKDCGNTIEDGTSLTTSIECTELSEEILGLEYDENQMDGPPPSVTSIVYCAPGSGDETPLTVQLPAGNNTKPLGSSENPIQLVQQGQTFQALQPVHEKQLEQITALLQQRRISAPPSQNHQEIYDPETNMKIVYKVVYPSDIVGIDSDDEEDECVDVEGCYTTWSNMEAESYLSRPRGRPINKFKKTDDLTTFDTMEENASRKIQLSISRTRSGRISRPPKHMLKDFKRGHVVASAEANKDITAGSTELENKQPVPGLDDMKPQEPVIVELPSRKKRDLGAATRLRYTCLTCGKLYMGRIEGHYAKFPDHRRSHHSEGIVQKSYSALKVMSEVSKINMEERTAADVNKSVLSPTPGTKASETCREPSLPMETSNSFQAQEGSSGTTPNAFDTDQDIVINNEYQTLVDTTIRGKPRGRGRGRPRGRGRGRGVRRGSTSDQSPATQHTASNSEMLQKVLSSYSNSEILEATGKRVVDNLQPWQLLSYKATGHLQPDTLQHWQKTVDELQILIDQAKEAVLHHLTPHVPHDENPQLYSQQNRCKWEKEVSRSKSLKENAVSSGATENETSQDNQEMETDSENIGTRQIHVEETVATALRLDSGLYKKKASTNESNSMLENHLPETENGYSKIPPEPALKKIKIETSTITPSILDTSGIMSDITSTCVPDVKPTLHRASSSNNDSIYNIKHENCLSLVVDSLGLSTNSTGNNIISSTPTKQLNTSMLSNLDNSIPPCSLSNINNSHSYAQINHTSTTSSQEQGQSCQTQTTTQCNTPLKLNTKNISLPSCVDVSNLSGSHNNTPESQLQSVSHQLLEELNITAADLPRLLSEGTGHMVIGTGGDTNDHCDAPLNTSGDTTDLSEMLFKLQEATAGIAQGFPNTGTSLNHVESSGNQLTPQNITPQFMEQEEAANHSLKPSEGTQNGALVTSFVGALDPTSLSTSPKQNNLHILKSSDHKNTSASDSPFSQRYQIDGRFIHNNRTANCNDSLEIPRHLTNLRTSSIMTSSTLSRCIDTPPTQSNCNTSLCTSSTIDVTQSHNSSNIINSDVSPSKPISSSSCVTMNPLSVSCSADNSNNPTSMPILSLSPISSSSVDNSMPGMNTFTTPDSSSLLNFPPPVNASSKNTSGTTLNAIVVNSNLNQKCSSNFQLLPSYTSESNVVSTIDSSNLLKSSHNNLSTHTSAVNLNPPLLNMSDANMSPLDAACSSLNNLPTIDCSSINASSSTNV